MTFAIRWREDASGFVGPHAGKLASKAPHFTTEGEAETVRLGMPNAEYAEVIVVPDEPEREWVFDDAARARVAVALAEIDANQAHLPTCALCGQRSLKLDRFGLCSKVSQPHLDWRAGVRADEKAGVAR
jgi:hypothetical protein